MDRVVKKRNFLLMLLILTVSIAFFLATTAGCTSRAVDYEQVGEDERIVIKFSHVVAESTPKGMAAKKFAQLVHERSNGRVEVQVYPNSQLYQDGEEVDALQSNYVQMIAPATAKMVEYFPKLLIYDLPFVFEDYNHVYLTSDGKVGEEILASTVESGMLGVAIWDNGFKQIGAIRPIRHPNDFKGLRFRIMDEIVLADQYEKFGANTVVLPFNEVYSALEQRRVNGIENTLSNIVTKRFYQHQPYLTISNHGYLGYIVLVNEQFWNDLPDDIREIVDEALVEVTYWQRQIAEAHNKEALREIEILGNNEVIYLTDEERDEWRKLLRPIYEEYVGFVGRELFDAVTKNVRAQP